MTLENQLPLTLPFTFGATEGGGEEAIAFSDNDLSIYYNNGASSFTVRCSRWDTDNYNIVVEAWVTKAQYNNIIDNCRPGAVRELKRVIYSPKYYDSSWQGYNTLALKPVPGTELYRMRGREKVIFPKSIHSEPLEGESGWILLKIESAISGGTYVG